MLQAGDQARFALEAADEVRVIGVLRQDDLNDDLAGHRSLICPVDLPDPPSADALAQLVTSDLLVCRMIHVLSMRYVDRDINYTNGELG
jgi:hypothetical protein